MRKFVLLFTCFSALMVGYFVISPLFRTELKTGPVSTIGKSGEMKSPGGQPAIK